METTLTLRATLGPTRDPRGVGRLLHGKTIVQDGASVTVRCDAGGIPELILADGRVWERLGSTPAVEMLLREFGDASVVTH